MAKVGSVSVELKATGARQAARDINNVADSAKRAGKAAGKAADGFRAMAAAGTALAASAGAAAYAMTQLADAAGELEYALAGVKAITKATSSQYGALKNAAIQAGIATQFSPVEAVDGLRSLATAGQTVEQSLSSLIPVLDLAAGSLGQLGVQRSAEAVVGTLNAYGMEANDATKVTDKLLRITQMTNLQTRDFSAALARAAAVGGAYNQSLDDMLIGLGLLRNRNIAAEISSTALAQSILKIVSSQDRQQQLQKIGVQVFDQMTGKMRSILDIISDLDVATRNMTEAERQNITSRLFGARAILAFAGIAKAQVRVMKDGREVTLRGAEAIEVLRQRLEDSAGTAAEFRKELLDTYEGIKILIKGSMQTLAALSGEAFAQTFRPFLEFFYAGINNVIRFLMRMTPEAQKAFAVAITGATLFTGAVGTLLISLGALGIAIPLISTGFASMKAAMVVLAGAVGITNFSMGTLILRTKAFLMLGFVGSLRALAVAAGKAGAALATMFATPIVAGASSLVASVGSLSRLLVTLRAVVGSLAATFGIVGATIAAVITAATLAMQVLVQKMTRVTKLADHARGKPLTKNLSQPRTVFTEAVGSVPGSRPGTIAPEYRMYLEDMMSDAPRGRRRTNPGDIVLFEGSVAELRKAVEGNTHLYRALVDERGHFLRYELLNLEQSEAALAARMEYEKLSREAARLGYTGTMPDTIFEFYDLINSLRQTRKAEEEMKKAAEDAKKELEDLGKSSKKAARNFGTIKIKPQVELIGGQRIIGGPIPEGPRIVDALAARMEAAERAAKERERLNREFRKYLSSPAAQTARMAVNRPQDDPLAGPAIARAKLFKAQQKAIDNVTAGVAKAGELLDQLGSGQVFQMLGSEIGMAIGGPAGAKLGTEIGRILDALAPPEISGGVMILLKSLGEVLAPVLIQLAPLFVMLGDAIKVLLPIFMILGEVVGMLARIIFEILRLLSGVLLAFGGAAAMLVGALIELVAFIADFIGFDEFAENARAFVDAIHDTIRDLGNAIAEADFDDAMARARDEALGLADAANQAAESLLNVPTGFKVARARHAAAEPVVMDDFIQRPGQPAQQFSPDDNIIGVKDLSNLGTTIIIQSVNVDTNDPSSFIRRLIEMVDADDLRGGVGLGNNWQGRP